MTSVVRLVTFTKHFHALSHYTTIRNKGQKDRKRERDIDFAVFGGSVLLPFRGNCEESVENEIVTGSACAPAVSVFVRVPTTGQGKNKHAEEAPS